MGFLYSLRHFLYCSFRLRSRTFRFDVQGATAVEFALLAGPTLLTLATLFVVGLDFYMSASLDAATLEAGRAVAIGQVSPAALTAAQFKQNILCPSLPASFNCANVFVNMKVLATGSDPSPYYSYVNSNESGLIQPPLNTTGDTFCPGAGSQYVLLEVLYPIPSLLGFLTPSTATIYNGQKVDVLMSTLTFKSEPYANASTYAGC